VLKTVVALFGYHFASTHTDRTPENFKSLFSFLHLTFVVNVVATGIVHKFINHHIHHYSATLNKQLSHEAHAYIRFAKHLIWVQIAGYVLFYFLVRKLYKKELTQAKIVDTVAASIKHHAKHQLCPVHDKTQ
jgi:lysylphosphatidylglycerol synthetase-like protein (DUF2156 family)